MTRRNMTCVVTENKPTTRDEQTRPQVLQIYETEVVASTTSRRTSSLRYINSSSSSYMYDGGSELVVYGSPGGIFYGTVKNSVRQHRVAITRTTCNCYSGIE